MKLLYRAAVVKIFARFFGSTICHSGALAGRLLVFVLLFGVGGKAWGQSLWNSATTGGAWLTAGNWTPSGVPSTTGYAQFQLNPTGTGTVGINMNNPTNNGSNNQAVGGIEVTGARAVPLAIGNSTTAAAGIFTLNGTTINGVSNVILRNNTTQSFTIQQNIGGGTSAMTIALGNATANIINVDGTGGLIISIPVSGAGRNLTKAGTGAGGLTLSASNTYTGGLTLSAGTLNINNASALGTIAGTFTVNGGVINNTSGSAITTSNYPQTWGGDFTFTGSNALNLGTAAVSLSATRQVTVSASTLTVGGVISGSFGLTKAGNGILLLGGVNTYTGITSVNSGELRLNPSADNSLSGACTFNTGTLSTTGIAASRTITFGSINVSDNSTLALASATSHTINFASLGTLTPGKMLTITGWSGNYAIGTTTGTSGKVVIGSALTTAQLAQVRFFNGTNYYAAVQLGTGEIVPAAVLVVTNPGNQTAGAGFTVTVTSKDLDGNARALTNATGITLTSGTNTIGGTTTGTIAAGGNTATISGVTLTAGTNATITATRTASPDNPAPGTSGTFDVAAATTPVIAGLVTATGTATFNFFSTNYGTAATAQQFDITGTDITAATGITVTPPAGFEVSKTSATSGFAGSGNAITVGAAGTIASTAVWLRLAAGASVSGTYNSQTIALTSTGATTVNLSTATSGNVIAKLPITVQANTPVPKTFGTALTGGSSTAFSVTSGTLVSGESITGVTLSYGSGAAACDPPGNTTNVVTPSAATGSGGFNATNYFITYLGGDITVSKATPVITVTGTASYAYDGNPQGPDTYSAPAAGSCGTVSSGSVTYTYTNNGGTPYGPTATKPTLVGSYLAVADIAADANYNNATSANFAFAIISGTITLSPATQTQGPFCNASGNQIILTYNTSGTVTAPFIQLSNAAGSFASGTTNISPDYISGSGPYTIAATFALGLTAGTGYRARIVSIDATPVISLDNGSNITVTQATTPTVSITSSPAAVAGTTTICAGTNVTFTPAPVNLSGATYTITWWKGGAGTGTNLGTSATYSSTSLTNGDISCIMENIAGGCTTGPDPESNAITMLVNPVLTPSVSIASSPAAVAGTTAICTGNNVTFTPTPTNGGASPSYHWWKNGIGTGTDLGISATYASTTLTNGNTIACVMTSNATCASPTTANAAAITIAVNTPGTPTGYSGTNTVYPGQTGVTYSVTNVSGVTYTWAYSGTGYTIASGQGTNSITIDYAAGATAGTLSVTPSVAGCNGTPLTQAITVAPINDLCANATGLTVGAAAVTGTLVNSTPQSGFTEKDVWYTFTPTCTGAHTITLSGFAGVDIDFKVYSASCPAGSGVAALYSQTSGGTGITEINTNNYTLGTTYYIRAFVFSGTPSTFSISVVGNAPATPGTITGAVSPCVGVSTSYSIAAVANASSYTWSLPLGWAGTSTINSISVTPSATTGNVSVTANNCYGTSGANTLGTTPLSIPATPGSITGSAGVCSSTAGLAYSIAAVPGAASYTWTVPSDWSAPVGTTSITTNSGIQSGSVSVTATNGCGTSSAQTLAVTTTTMTAPTATVATLVGSNAFTANWGTVGGATGYEVDVYTFTGGSTLATWTFPSSGTTVTPDVFSAANSSKTLTTNGGTIIDVPGATTRAPSANAWNGGSGTKAWQILIDASGFYNLKLSSKQISSNTGPRDFKVQYKLSSAGAWVDVSGTALTVLNDVWVSGVLANIALPAACDNQPTLYIQWVMTSNVSANAGVVAAGGTSRIDDISVKGDIVSYVPGYQDFAATTSPLELTGLAASTTYNYLVRSTNGSCTSVNSNIISATTAAPCVPTATISSFLPATGPAYTVITITGTGFTGATAVKFGSTAASFTVINSTTINVEVPVNAPTDKISVTVGGCDAVSSGNFTIIGASGCGNGALSASDLMISEVYDAESGSLSYIEIFNATGGPRSLSGYQIKIKTYGDNGGTAITTYSLGSSNLNNGSVFVLSVGKNSPTCSAVSAGISYAKGSGFNGNDEIWLQTTANVDIDYVPNPNYPGNSNPGFSMLRNSTATNPSTSYISSQWTNYSTESCGNLGSPPYVASASLVTISPQPSDYTACTVPVSFATNSSGSGSGSNAILWKFYNPYTNAWDNASNVASLSQLYSTITTANTTSNTMTISGNVAQLQNYQFYAQVTRGTCIVASDAVQYSYSSKAYYRSNTVSGNWSSPASWQMSDDGVTWTAACSYPIAANSIEVFIQNGHTITLDLDLDIDKLTVSNTGNTGTLVISNTSHLKTLNSQAGADLIVNGVLTDNGSSGNGIDFEDNTGTVNDATWILASTGTVIKTNLSSAANYRDFFEGGIATIPAAANWIYRHTGSSIGFASATTTTPMYYPNLTLENTVAGNTYASALNIATPNLSTFTMLGSSNPIIVKGNFDVGGSGSGYINFLNINTYSPVRVDGALTIKSLNSLTNIGNVSNYGNGFELKGDITNAGTLTSNYNASNAGSGQLLLTGTSNQVISGAGSFSLYDMTVNNGSGGSVTLNTDILVPHNLTFTNGIVNTTASPNGLLTLGSATNAVLGSPGTAAFVNGPMAKQTITGSTEFEFPVGKTSYAAKYKPNYVLPVTASGTTTYTSEFFPANPAAAYPDPFISTLIYIYRHYYWKVDRTGSGTARVALDYNPAADPGGTTPADWTSAWSALASPPAIPAATNVAVVKDFGTYWDFTKGPINFNDQGPMYEARYYTTTGKIYTAVLNTFSPFTFGFDYNTILPVNLLSFTGQLVVADGKLIWKVADSKDLDGFDLEYSRDGRRYQKLAGVKSNGGTDYGFLHTSLPAGANYYRLLVKDKNGKTFYSQVVLLNVGKLHTYLVGLTPTIVSGELIPVIFSAKNQPVQAMITDVLGRRISNEKSILQPGSNQWRINTQSLAKGMYFITLLTEDGLQETRKFLKE